MTGADFPRYEKVYLASPFFNPEQLLLVKTIEVLIKNIGLECYSPRLDGVLQDMSPEERARSTKRIFEKNCAEIMKCDAMFAILNDRDTGTIWELGFGYAYKQFRNLDYRIITFTSGENKENVMLKECVNAHAHGLEQAEAFLLLLKSGEQLLPINDIRDTF